MGRERAVTAAALADLIAHGNVGPTLWPGACDWQLAGGDAVLQLAVASTRTALGLVIFGWSMVPVPFSALRVNVWPL